MMGLVDSVVNYKLVQCVMLKDRRVFLMES